jgi:flagellar FliL protein
VAEEQAQQQEEQQEQQEEGAVQKKSESAEGGGQQKLVFIVLIVNAVVLVVVAVLFWLNMSKQSKVPSLQDVEEQAQVEKHGEKGDGHGEKKDAKDGATPDANTVVESFTVNLAGNEGNHYAKVDIAIEVANDFVKDELLKIKPKVRDFIVIMLSSKSYDQIMSADGVEFLREEIRNKINGYLTKGEVKDIYFTNFIVQ